ncbi:MAG TPA: PH domain-containing protein [Thermoplasmata archaeon]|nr:PH domain-containing protein [Thermoplasmata archaeon]
MATTSAPRKMPRLLKATYLADQEYLFEETRATALFYFPGPIVYLLVVGFFAGITEAARRHWSALQIGWWTTHVVDKLPKGDRAYLSYFFDLLFVIGLLFLLVRYLRWVSTVYAVTNRRVIVQKGILSRDFDEIPVVQVRGVDVHQSIGDRMLGFGSVRVSSEGGSRLGNEDWKGIPKPFRFQKLIEDAAQGSSPVPPR